MAKLHSLETMGLFDGPGIRTVFFLQGCPLRCSYCHNVDTQSRFAGREITISEITARVKRMMPYFKNGKGGVTFSGGEPMMNGGFLVEAIKAVKDLGVHVAVDTSGVGDQKYYSQIIDLADLIILDIKHYHPLEFKAITQRSIDPLLRFMSLLQVNNTPVWIRHVMMKGYTDSKVHMDHLCDFISPLIPRIEKLEILPYHTMGVEKYKTLGIPYLLEGMEDMDKSTAKKLETYANSVIQSYDHRKHKVI